MISIVDSLECKGDDIPLHILCILLGNVGYKTIGETVFIRSVFTVDEIEDCVGHRYDITATLSILETTGKLKIRGKDIFVGVKHGKRKLLYANTEDSDDALVYLKPFYYSYLANVPKKEAHLGDLWHELEHMAETVINLTADDFLRVYSLAYGFVCQEPIRQFQRKEIDQMKNFVKLYSNKEAFDLIIYYITNSEKFKYALSMGTLLLKKDEVREAMKSKRKKLSPKSYRRNDDF